MAPSEAEKDAALFVLEGLDRMEAEHRKITASPHYLIDQCRSEIVIDPATGQPVLDPEPARRSENELAKIAKMHEPYASPMRGKAAARQLGKDVVWVVLIVAVVLAALAVAWAVYEAWGVATTRP
jgi:hypothetical protein